MNVQPFIDAINTINRLHVNDLSGTIDIGSFNITDPSHVTTARIRTRCCSSRT